MISDLISMYVSGFYSRFKEGKLRIYKPWKNGEVEVFSHFKTPSNMAEALSIGYKRKSLGKIMI